MASKKSNRRSRKSSAQPDLNTFALKLAAGAAAIGALLSLYATQLTFTLAGEGLVEASGCSVNEWINCDLAHGSSYAELFGIPVSWWGFLFYAFAGLAAVRGFAGKNRSDAAGGISFAFVLAIGSVLYSIVKAFHLVQLGVLCPVCLGMYASNLALLVLLPLGLGVGPKGWGGFLTKYVAGIRGDDEALGFDPNLKRWGLLVVMLFGLGYLGMYRYAEGQNATAKIDMDLALRAHFRQTPYDIAVDPGAGSWGNPEGKVEVVEFADFQCPACRESAFHLRPTIYEFKNDVSLRFMHFPLDTSINDDMQRQVHAFAGAAAKATECASERGDFWDFHDDLFRNQVTIGLPLIRDLVEERGWSVPEFEACMESEPIIARIKSDIQAALAASLESTPTIYVNGRKITYWQNEDFIRAVIREELKRQ